MCRLVVTDRVTSLCACECYATIVLSTIVVYVVVINMMCVNRQHDSTEKPV